MNRAVARIRIPKSQELIYGIHPVRAVLDTESRVAKRVFVVDDRTHADLLKRVPASTPIQTLDEATLTNLLPSKYEQQNAQGIAVQVDKVQLQVTAGGSPAAFGLAAAPAPLLLCLEGVTDPHNTGALLRSALLLGADGLLLPHTGAAPLGPTVAKASAGALEAFVALNRLWCAEQLAAALHACAASGWAVIGAAAATSNININSTSTSSSSGTTAVAAAEPQRLQPSIPASDLRRTGPTIVVLGNESRGLSSGVAGACTALTHVHMPVAPALAAVLHRNRSRRGGDLPVVDSLNVAVAGALLLQALQRRQ